MSLPRDFFRPCTVDAWHVVRPGFNTYLPLAAVIMITPAALLVRRCFRATLGPRRFQEFRHSDSRWRLRIHTFAWLGAVPAVFAVAFEVQAVRAVVARYSDRIVLRQFWPPSTREEPMSAVAHVRRVTTWHWNHNHYDAAVAYEVGFADGTDWSISNEAMSSRDGLNDVDVAGSIAALRGMSIEEVAKIE